MAESNVNYIVLEQQTTGDVTAVVPPDPATSDLNAALSSFFSKASYAAISQVEIHTISLITDDGRLVRPSECFRHLPVNTPQETEPEELEEPIEEP